MQLAPGTLVGDRYVVDGPLGQGGMAVVYRVHHRALGTVHALKIVGLTSASARERLMREGRLQGRLQHPNVVAVTDQLEIQGVPALVLELVDGPPLSSLVGAALSVDQIDALGAGILAGVGAAHRLGLIHRDLKPGNVLVAVQGGRAVPKVTDFGLAVAPASDDRSTRTGVALGTPEYMAPEQVRNAKDVDARADVWALGVVLYELASGHLPFEDDDRLALFQKITAGAFVPLRERRRDLPERMYETVAAALRVDRADRPPDADALLLRWSAEVREAPIDDLVSRVLSLAPSMASSGGGSTPAPAREDATGHATTWMPPAPTEREPSILADPLPPPPPPAVRTRESPWAGAAFGVGGLVVGIGVGSLLVAAVGLAWTLRTGPSVDPAALETRPPTPGPADAAPDRPRFLPPTAARDLLADGRFTEAERQGGMFLGTSEDALFLVATAAEASGSRYASRENLSKAARRAEAESRAAVFGAALAGRPGPLTAWTVAHPDDVEAHLWRLWGSCPGSACADAGASVAALERLHPGRGIGAYARQLQARETGDLPAAHEALDRWAAAAPDEVVVRFERARLALAEGDTATAAAALEPLSETDGRRFGAVWGLRGAVDLRLGREVAYQHDREQALAGPVATVATFALPVADTLLALGRPGDAAQVLDESEQRLARYDDAISQVMRAELLLRRAAIALHQGDREKVEALAVALRQVADRTDHEAWGRERAGRYALVAEGLRLVARGDRAAAASRLAELEALSPGCPDLLPLERALDRG